jgi:nucleoside-diphosphate-sugar epimerase
MNIAILGCGWLGLPLGESLAKSNTVKGSVTSTERFPLLQEKGIMPFCIDLNAPDVEVLQNFLDGCDVLIISIPPKAGVKSDLSYPERIKIIIPHIASSGVKNVLFTSSVSVYGEDESLPVVDETTLPNPQTESGKQVLEAEMLLQDCPDFKTTIIRLGGLVGGERHPVYHLAGKQNLENANGPVNLINREECIDIITRIIQRQCWGEVFTAVHPTTKSRKEYYTEKAKEFGLPEPQFSEGGSSKGKVVKGQDKLAALLGFTFV